MMGGRCPAEQMRTWSRDGLNIAYSTVAIASGSKSAHSSSSSGNGETAAGMPNYGAAHVPLSSHAAARPDRPAPRYKARPSQDGAVGRRLGSQPCRASGTLRQSRKAYLKSQLGGFGARAVPWVGTLRDHVALCRPHRSAGSPAVPARPGRAVGPGWLVRAVDCAQAAAAPDRCR